MIKANMNRLLTLVLISLSLTKVDFVVSVSTNSSRGNSEEQPTPTFPDFTTLPPSTGPFSCPSTALYNILHAYAVADKEVGYCQGLSFVAGLIILHVSYMYFIK